MEGWIRLHRQIADNRLWQERPFSRGQAWVDLILLANHRPGYIRVRGIRVDVDRGQLAYAERTLAERWGWSRGKVVRFLNELKTDEMCYLKRDHKITIITICNYEKYQTEDETDRTTNGTTDRTADGPQTDQNKNGKNGENKKEDPHTPARGYEDRVCVYCGIRQSESPWGFDRDHFLPVSAGGDDREENLVDACHVCNQIKQKRVFRNIEEARAHIHWTLWSSGRDRYKEARGLCFGGKKPTGVVPNTVRRGSGPVSEYSQGFLLFWEAYPRRVAKKAAYVAWQKAAKLGTVTAKEIIQAIKKQVAAGHFTNEKGETFYPHPATWLNGGRWEDEISGNGDGSGQGQLPLGPKKLEGEERLAQLLHEWVTTAEPDRRELAVVYREVLTQAEKEQYGV